jgi:hypothetical protein
MWQHGRRGEGRCELTLSMNFRELSFLMGREDMIWGRWPRDGRKEIRTICTGWDPQMTALICLTRWGDAWRALDQDDQDDGSSGGREAFS